MNAFKNFLFLICINCGLIIFTSFSSAETITPSSKTIPTTLFGMHIHRAATVSLWPTAPFKTWRLWDANVSWPSLEPKKGQWNFKELDKLVDLASRKDVGVLLPLGLSPRWASSRPDEPSSYNKPGFAAEPTSIEDWRNYVRIVAQRYKGRVHYYEIWNEPNLPGFFSGKVDDMILLTREAARVLKEVDPTIVVVSPSPTASGTGPRWLDSFLAKGGGQYVDVIGYHFYVSPKPPEEMLPLIRQIRLTMGKHGISKPLWNTEAGWFMANQKTTVKVDAVGFKSKVLSNDEAMAYIARAYIINWAMGVERFYWYAWDNGEMGLTEADGKTVKVQAAAYTEIQKWLVGARMIECTSDDKDIWICQLTRDVGYNARIVWNPNKKVSFYLPETWGVREIRDLNGNKRAVKKGTAPVEIGPIPQLLENITH